MLLYVNIFVIAIDLKIIHVKLLQGYLHCNKLLFQNDLRNSSHFHFGKHYAGKHGYWNNQQITKSFIQGLLYLYVTIISGFWDLKPVIKGIASLKLRSRETTTAAAAIATTAQPQNLLELHCQLFSLFIICCFVCLIVWMLENLKLGSFLYMERETVTLRSNNIWHI